MRSSSTVDPLDDPRPPRRRGVEGEDPREAERRTVTPRAVLERPARPVDHEGLADLGRDHLAPAGRVVLRHQLEEAVDLRVLGQVVAGDRDLDAEHLGGPGGLVGVHLPGEERRRPGIRCESSRGRVQPSRPTVGRYSSPISRMSKMHVSP